MPKAYVRFTALGSGGTATLSLVENQTGQWTPLNDSGFIPTAVDRMSVGLGPAIYFAMVTGSYPTRFQPMPTDTLTNFATALFQKG